MTAVLGFWIWPSLLGSLFETFVAPIKLESLLLWRYELLFMRLWAFF